jgi:hypothetical protein
MAVMASHDFQKTVSSVTDTFDARVDPGSTLLILQDNFQPI